MFVKTIKYTLYSISISLLAVSTIIYLSGIHLQDETLADMALVGIISVPLLLALNYVMLSRSKPAVPISSEVDAAKAMVAETATIAALPAVGRDESSAPKRRLGA